MIFIFSLYTYVEFVLMWSHFLGLHLHSRPVKPGHTGTLQSGCGHRAGPALWPPFPADSSHSTSTEYITQQEREKKTKTKHWLSFSRASGSTRLVFQPKICSDWLKLLIAEILWLNNTGFCTDKYERQALCLCGRQKGRLFARSQLTDRQRESRISVKKTNWQLLVDVIPSGIRVVVNQSSRQAANVSQGRVRKVQRVREWVFNLGYARDYIYMKFNHV